MANKRGSTRRKDISNHRFGRLIAKRVEYVDSNGHAYWLCVCDCGGQKTVRASHLHTGNVTSCGCAKGRKTHGERHGRIYTIWANMKQRCNNRNARQYQDYGGRGITVCDEWDTSYEAFRDWAKENGYRDDLTIDRINNDGPYTPENCRWATPRDQSNNTRRNRYLTHNGETHSVSEWARILGINQGTLRKRLYKYKWSTEDALGKEVKKNGT